MLSNKHLNAIDNPRLVNLKLFDITYIPGKMMLGGIAALFMYGVRQCTDVYEGVLQYNDRVVIPASLKTRVLQTLTRECYGCP